MKEATLLHNPKAGDEEHSKKELVGLVEAAGYKCRYTSTKKDGWDEFKHDVDVLIIAGGDGTVRKAIGELAKRNELDKAPPIALLPLGTANNISRALNISGNEEEIISRLEKAKTVKFDVGIVDGAGEANFFLEAFGFGLFPSFINKVREDKIDKQPTVEEEVQAVLKAFHEFIFEFAPRKYSVNIDGKDLSGEYLAAEVMNVPSMGTNFRFAPAADVTDGKFDVVLISEQEKGLISDYILEKMKGRELQIDLPTVKAKEVNITWDGTKAHADDKAVLLTPLQKVKISMEAGLLRFLV
jgi:diacylglycerol kinase (ATP)